MSLQCTYTSVKITLNTYEKSSFTTIMPKQLKLFFAIKNSKLYLRRSRQRMSIIGTL